MSETSIHLVDSVLPQRAIRQWVMTFPIPLRPLLAIRPKIMARCLEITTAAINDYYRKKTGLKKAYSKTGAVTLIQRFGGAINLNVHFHQLFVDGVYGLDGSKDFTDFQSVGPPSLEELDQVLKQVIQRVTRYLEKQKIIIRDEEDHLQIRLDDQDAFARLQASSSTYRFLTGPNKGKKALVLKSVDQDHSSHKGLVVYQLKKAYDDGTTHVVMEPLELLEKLSAIIPRPRVPVAQPGVVVLSLQQQLLEKKKKQQRMCWARLLKRVFNIDVETCVVCGGKMRIIAAVEDPQVIKKILNHLGLPSTPPLAKPARGPPLSEWDDYHQTFFEEYAPSIWSEKKTLRGSVYLKPSQLQRESSKSVRQR